ncbi:immune inhibitor A domain-containing protein, partial [Acinetobacter baumannii]
TYNGKKLYRSGFNNELLGNESWPETKQINGIGLFVHEFSHCLGLPDFYASRLTSIYDNQGMEDWSVMDNGTYNMNGYVPAA